MNRIQWDMALRNGMGPTQLGRLAVSDTWSLPAYIGEAGSVPARFLADCALEAMAALHAYHLRRGNRYRVAAMTIVGSSAYLETVEDSDPRTIVMVIRRGTPLDDLADCLTYSAPELVAAELARITRTVRSLDAMGKRWGKS